MLVATVVVTIRWGGLAISGGHRYKCRPPGMWSVTLGLGESGELCYAGCCMDGWRQYIRHDLVNAHRTLRSRRDNCVTTCVIDETTVSSCVSRNNCLTTCLTDLRLSNVRNAAAILAGANSRATDDRQPASWVLRA